MRVLAAAAALVAGAALGAASVAVHATWWGLPLAVAATVAAAYAVPPGWATRVPLAGGWAAVVAALSVRRGEGDLLVTDGVAGYVLLGAGLVLVVTSVVTVPPPRRAGSTDDQGSAP